MSVDQAFTNFPTLRTQRLHLRPIRPDDAEALFATLSDEQVTEFYGYEPHKTLADTRSLIARIQAGYRGRESIQWGITRQGEERVIGSCSLHHFRAEFQCAEIGYELNQAFWRQGMMFEATSAILSYAFYELGCHRIEAIIDELNVRSKRLLLKPGFTYEGNLRQRYFFQGRFEDEHFFGLLRDEWHAAAV
jgi:ribosomal-protein-alanine N-acetyltransferase